MITRHLVRLRPVRSFRPVHRLRGRLARRLRTHPADAGMSTAEYAVGTVAAVAFAVVLYKVITSGAVMSALSGIVRHALNVHI